MKDGVVMTNTFWTAKEFHSSSRAQQVQQPWMPYLQTRDS